MDRGSQVRNAVGRAGTGCAYRGGIDDAFAWNVTTATTTDGTAGTGVRLYEDRQEKLAGSDGSYRTNEAVVLAFLTFLFDRWG